MSILLVRHAETVENAAHVIQLPTTPLSAAGRVQAEHLAKRVAENGVARILASDLLRAVETAAYVSAQTGIQVVHWTRGLCARLDNFACTPNHN